MYIPRVLTRAAFAAATGLAVASAASGASSSRNNATAPQSVESKGRAIYMAQCACCHGIAGKGDGRAAVDLSVQPADLTDPDVAGASEKKLLRKLLRSPKPMPNFEELLTDNERLEVVKYVRSLAKTVVDAE